MNATEITELVRSQIQDAWDTTNLHHVDIRKALVSPRLIKVIQRLVKKGKIHDTLLDVWLILVENPASGTGYRIVAASDGSKFGLASEGFPTDAHLVLTGWYGDFLTTFHGM